MLDVLEIATLAWDLAAMLYLASGIQYWIGDVGPALVNGWQCAS